MKVTASHVRKNLASILDQVAETGVPVEIEYKGRVLRMEVDQKLSKLDRLKKHDYVVGDLESIIHMDWSKEWSELKSRTSYARGVRAQPKGIGRV